MRAQGVISGLDDTIIMQFFYEINKYDVNVVNADKYILLISNEIKSTQCLAPVQVH